MEGYRAQSLLDWEWLAIFYRASHRVLFFILFCCCGSRGTHLHTGTKVAPFESMVCRRPRHFWYDCSEYLGGDNAHCVGG
jgi:hypothetical protein